MAQDDLMPLVLLSSFNGKNGGLTGSKNSKQLFSFIIGKSIAETEGVEGTAAAQLGLTSMLLGASGSPLFSFLITKQIAEQEGEAAKKQRNEHIDLDLDHDRIKADIDSAKDEIKTDIGTAVKAAQDAETASDAVYDSIGDKGEGDNLHTKVDGIETAIGSDNEEGSLHKKVSDANTAIGIIDSSGEDLHAKVKGIATAIGDATDIDDDTNKDSLHAKIGAHESSLHNRVGNILDEIGEESQFDINDPNTAEGPVLQTIHEKLNKLLTLTWVEPQATVVKAKKAEKA